MKEEQESQADKIRKATDVLKSGGVVLLGTDTVWGLSCDASNEKAIEKIKKIKDRNDDQSFILLVSSDAMLERYVNDVPDVAWDIIDMSENPITVIYPIGINLPSNAFHHDGSVAIRIANDPILKKVIQYVKKPIVSTSANISGQKAPRSISEVSNSILASVDYVLDLPTSNKTTKKASAILKIGPKGEIKIIRK